MKKLEHFILDKELVKKYGAEEVIVLNELSILRDEYRHARKDEAVEWTYEDIQKATGYMSMMQVRRIITKLKKMKAIEVIDLGGQNRRAYLINWSEVE